MRERQQGFILEGPTSRVLQIRIPRLQAYVFQVVHQKRMKLCFPVHRFQVSARIAECTSGFAGNDRPSVEATIETNEYPKDSDGLS